MPDEPREPTLEELRSVAEFSKAFDTPDFRPGEWVLPETREDGVIVLGWWNASATVMDWERELYDSHVIDPHSDYLTETFGCRMREFTANPSLLMAQDLQTIRTILTNISRGERFCDGYMAGMFESGVAQAATRRLAELVGETHGPSGSLAGKETQMAGTGAMHELSSHLPPGVSEHLGYYVYLYVDPRTERPFYVGKGKGERVLAHLSDDRDSDKVRLIGEIRSVGLQPRLEVLAHGLKDEETAFRVEAAVIEVLGLGDLTNIVSGWKSLQVGRMTLEELAAFYAAKPVTITEPVILIRINSLFRKNMSDLELYEATRGLWRLGDDRVNAKYAMAVFESVVREVYEIEQWFPACTQTYQTRDLSQRDLTGRWEFKGSVAPESIRSKYFGGSVVEYFTKGNQNPVRYVNIKTGRQKKRGGCE